MSLSAEPTEDEERSARARRIMEAMIFAAGRPVDAATLAAQVPEGTDVDGELVTLAAYYEHRGVQLVKVAGGWTFRTAADLADHLAVHRVVRRRLSRAALETLAIIAYHQPVTRAEVEEIRGVHVGRGTLDILLDAGWIAPKGRRRTPGRPVTWVTTSAFMEHFGLECLDDLPGVDELEAAGLLDSPDPQAEGAGEAPIRSPSEEEGGCAPDDAEVSEEDASAEAISTTVVPLSGRGGPS
ncbi:MAG: SMC-Scp complex subunit ScpB [Rhodospirillales bacterium]|nr:SMC-Scp complex subunit ScpB [Rhodospirillales bacterium]